MYRLLHIFKYIETSTLTELEPISTNLLHQAHQCCVTAQKLTFFVFINLQYIYNNHLYNILYTNVLYTYFIHTFNKSAQHMYLLVAKKRKKKMQ